MSRATQAWIWLAVLVIAGLAVYAVNDILLPFVAGILVAYFLDPVADRLERWGVSRVVATAIITVVFFAAVIAVVVVMVPLLQSQVVGFFRKVPALVDAATAWLGPIKAELQRLFPDQDLGALGEGAQSVAGTAAAWVGRLVSGVWQGGLAVFNAVSLVVITPVVCFYMLRDFDRMVAKVDSWLPRHFADTIRALAHDIDRTIAAFIRGQGTVALFLAALYGIGLTLVGLDFGLLVGIATGLLSFVPYIGMLVGTAVAVTIAIVQFGDILHVALVLVVFAVGQAFESAFLTPKLVGDRVGLHAVWVIFALMVGGLLLGFTGVLIAVPVAATIGVLVRFFLAQYLASPLYGAAPSTRSDPDDRSE